MPFAPDTEVEKQLTAYTRIGSAFNEDEGSGSRAMHSVSHTSQGNTFLTYVDLLLKAAARGVRGTFMYRKQYEPSYVSKSKP